MNTTQRERQTEEYVRSASQPGLLDDGECRDEPVWWPQVSNVTCPLCRRRVFSCNSTSVRLKTRILVFEHTYALAKCRYCRNDVIVPIVMNDSFEHERLTVWDEELHGVPG